MMGSSATVHDHYLDELINHIRDVDEDRRKIEAILKDPRWYKNDSYAQYKLCDLILLYYDGTARPMELKGSEKAHNKAETQINSGFLFITRVFPKYSHRWGKIVYYKSGDYKFEYVNPAKTPNYRRG